MLDYKDRLQTIEHRCSELSGRIIEARALNVNIPGALKSYDVALGLLDIGIVGKHRLSKMSELERNLRTRRAIAAVRTLIKGIIIGGVPSKRAFDFFDINDLNLLFSAHRNLLKSDAFLEVGFFLNQSEGNDDQ